MQLLYTKTPFHIRDIVFRVKGRNSVYRLKDRIVYRFISILRNAVILQTAQDNNCINNSNTFSLHNNCYSMRHGRHLKQSIKPQEKPRLNFMYDLCKDDSRNSAYIESMTGR
jgi:hypothetical protein